MALTHCVITCEDRTYLRGASMFKVLKKKGEYTMKKTLVIANVMLISSYVFGMNPYDTSNNMDEQNLTSVSNGISDGHVQVVNNR